MHLNGFDMEGRRCIMKGGAYHELDRLGGELYHENAYAYDGWIDGYRGFSFASLIRKDVSFAACGLQLRRGLPLRVHYGWQIECEGNDQLVTYNLTKEIKDAWNEFTCSPNQSKRLPACEEQ